MKRKKIGKADAAGKEASLLNADEEALLITVLSASGQPPASVLRGAITTPRLARALLNRLPVAHPRAVDILLTLHNLFEDKQTRKEIKRTAFKLKQKGLHILFEDKAADAVFQIQAARGVEPEAYISPIDVAGHQIVFLSLWQSTGRAVGVGTAHDEEGLLDFFFDRYSKKKAQEMKNIILERFQQMVPTSLAHAATVLEKAYQRSQDRLKSSAGSYLQCRPWLLEHIRCLEQPVIFESISRDRLDDIPLTELDLEKLFGHPFMENWRLDADRLKPFIEEIIRVLESPILVSEPQRETRIRDAQEKTLLELFPEDRRNLFRNRLEEMAYVFYRRQEEACALIALKAAFSLNDQKSPAQRNPFLKKLLERSLRFLMPENRSNPEHSGGKEAWEGSSLIIRP